MIDRHHDLPLSRQAKVLGISRGSVYYLLRAVPAADLALMRRIDALHLEYPFAGSRMLQGFLNAEGHVAGRLHVATLMKRMGIETLYRRPRTSKRAPGHAIFPYQLRKLPVTRPNQVWAMDSYIPMARGFVYLAAVVDWFSRKVLAWRLSITMDTAFCIEAVEDAMARFGKPEIFNTDQGSQFTSRGFTGLLIAADIRISMDGKGAWRDNVFVERLWKSVKYEEVYLRAYAQCVGQREDLSGHAALGAAYGLALSPPFAPWPWRWTLTDGGVDHGVFHVRFVRTGFEKLHEGIGLAPIAEAPERCAPVAEMGRKVAPRASRPRDP